MKRILLSFLILISLLGICYAATSFDTIQLRRDTAANWASINPIPAAGEPCLDTTNGIMKIGDGTTHYASLPFFSLNTLGSFTDIISKGPIVDARAYNSAALNDTTIAAAMAANPGKAIILAPGTWTISNNLSVTNQLIIPQGTILNIASGKNVNYLIQPQAGLYQIHSGSGTVTGLGIAYPEWWGAKGDEDTDDTVAIQSALNALPAKGGTLKILRTPMISSTIIINKNCRVDGGGASSYLIKKSTMTTPAVKITASWVNWEHVGIVGQVGNTGDGLVLNAPSVCIRRAFVSGMGGNGIRIGADVDVNTNEWLLDGVQSYSNTGHGVYIHSGDPVDVNAGTSIGLVVYSNGGDGLNIGRAMYNTFIGTLAEGNTGWGINYNPSSDIIGNNLFVGGDCEENTAGNFQLGVHTKQNTVHTGGLFYADVVNLGINNLILGDNTTFGKTWTPVISGEITAGAGTYSAQRGWYKRIGGTVWYEIELTWSAHTGTGFVDINLPLPVNRGANPVAFTPGFALTSAVTVAAGGHIVPLAVNTTSHLKLYIQNAGSIAGLDMGALSSGGSFWISGSYSVQ